jgi:hypothetical protein
MRLTEQQLSFFDTFGYLGFPGLFEDEISAITDSYEQVWLDREGGDHDPPHDGNKRSTLQQFVEGNEYLSSLVDDPRIDGITSSILGDDYNYSHSDGNIYVGDTLWHPDLEGRKAVQSFKMGFYLDPVGRESGCLRVIPGSHRQGDAFAEALREAAPSVRANRTEALWGVRGSEVPSVALETRPGDLIMFNHQTVHASYGGGNRRRMFTLNMEGRYREEDLPELRSEMARNPGRSGHESAYGDVMVRTAGPARMVHLEQRMANDGHLPEVVRKLREEKK